jgi:ABC-type nitrate/sulfonate/bicarbonate transport system substrate-binding protein
VSNLPPPPVPQKLREMFADYPELIQRLQEALDYYVEKALEHKPYDGAIQALLNILTELGSEARVELKAAKASGDATSIVRADKKNILIFEAGYIVFEKVDLVDLWDYFQMKKDAFE